MKHFKLFLFAVMAIMLSSCSNEPYFEYQLSDYEVECIPDSLKDKCATFITETVRAASYHMTGGDYEDPEDVVSRARQEFMRIYGNNGFGLIIKTVRPFDVDTEVKIKPCDLTEEQRYIRDWLLQNPQ